MTTGYSSNSFTNDYYGFGGRYSNGYNYEKSYTINNHYPRDSYEYTHNYRNKRTSYGNNVNEYESGRRLSYPETYLYSWSFR